MYLHHSETEKQRLDKLTPCFSFGGTRNSYCSLLTLTRWQHPKLTLPIFTPSLGGGGAERVVLKLAEGLAYHDYRVELVVVGGPAQYCAQLPREIPIVNLGASSAMASVPRLVRYLHRTRPRVLLSVLDHTNVAALIAERIAQTNVRRVICQHTTISRSAELKKDIRSRLIRLIVPLVYPWADRIIAVSQGTADDLARMSGLPRDRIETVYNPVVDSRMLSAAKEQTGHAWFSDPLVPVLLAVGRLEPRKDFDTLIRTFAMVRSRRRSRLLILGEGPERERLSKLISDLGLTEDIQLPGFVGNPYPFIRNASVLVLSSVTEALPTVLIEALACGTDIVSTDCPYGPREILAEGKYGLLVPVGSPELLAAAIENVLNGVSQRPGPESWIRFSVDLVIDQYIRILFEDHN